MAEDKQEWLGIYTSAGEGKPVALVAADGPLRDIRRAFAGQDSRIEPVAYSASENADIKALFAAPVTPDADPQAAADDVLRAQIRTELEDEERRKALTAEVKREMAAEKKTGQE